MPASGTQAGVPRERTTTPQCSPSGSAAFGAAWLDIDPGDEGGIGRQCGLDLFQRGDPARQRVVISGEPGLELAEGDAGPLAPVLQVLEPPRSLGLVEALGRGFHQAVQPLQFRDQFAEAGAFVGSEPQVVAGGQLVEQAAAQVFLERCQASAGCPSRASTAARVGRHDLSAPARSIPVKATRSLALSWHFAASRNRSRASRYLPWAYRFNARLS